MDAWNFMGGMGGFRKPEEGGLDFPSIMDQLGSYPTQRMNQSDINRGANIGPKTPGFEIYDPSQLAQIDRYAWGQQAGLGGLPVVAGYEGIKAASQMPGMQSLMGLLGRTGDAIGIPKASEFLRFDETTSPASGRNVSAYLKGALANPGFLSKLLGGR